MEKRLGKGGGLAEEGLMEAGSMVADGLSSPLGRISVCS